MLTARKPLRLPSFDYASSGAYFITVCVADRAPLFAAVQDGCLHLTPEGRTVEAAWHWLGTRFAGAVALDAFAVLPDHIHGVIWLHPGAPMPLGRYVAAFKGISTRLVNVLRASPEARLWQRGYHDSIVRSEAHLENIRQYIAANPARWIQSHP